MPYRNEKRWPVMSELKHYRLYTLDEDGHISKATMLEYLSEDGAVSFAREQERGGRSVELWHSSEQIAYIAASDPENVQCPSGGMLAAAHQG
jgi:hypothetical protein